MQDKNFQVQELQEEIHAKGGQIRQLQNEIATKKDQLQHQVYC